MFRHCDFDTDPFQQTRLHFLFLLRGNNVDTVLLTRRAVSVLRVTSASLTPRHADFQRQRREDLQLEPREVSSGGKRSGSWSQKVNVTACLEAS